MTTEQDDSESDDSEDAESEHTGSRRRTLVLVLVPAAITLLIGMAIGMVIESHRHGNGDQSESQNYRTYASAAPTAAAKPRTAITATDFTVQVQVISKKCFGSAGCIIQYTIDPEYIGAVDVTGRTFKVIYEVTGGKQPQTGFFTVSGGSARFNDKDQIDTESDADVLGAVVTTVIEN